MFGFGTLKKRVDDIRKDLDNLQENTNVALTRIDRKHKTEDCISSGRHNPTYFIRADEVYRIEIRFKYVFMCRECRQEVSLWESQLSPAQRQILVAMGELPKIKSIQKNK